MPTRRRPPTHRVVALAAVAVALTGCASWGGGDVVVESWVTSEEAAASPVVQVSQAGGFVPAGHDLRTVPQVTVYADGTAITHGPVAAVFPGPALPNLVRTQLGAAALTGLLDRARFAGMLTEVDYGVPPTADVPTTYVTVTLDGRSVTHEAPSLGVGDGVPITMAAGGPDAVPDDHTGPVDGVDAAQQAARRELLDVIEDVWTTVGGTGDGAPYEMTAFAVQARPVPAGEVAVEGVSRTTSTWPGELSLRAAAGCVVVDGTDGEVLAEALRQADALTVWQDGDEVYEVWARPLLPHESACPPAHP